MVLFSEVDYWISSFKQGQFDLIQYKLLFCEARLSKSDIYVRGKNGQKTVTKCTKVKQEKVIIYEDCFVSDEKKVTNFFWQKNGI